MAGGPVPSGAPAQLTSADRRAVRATAAAMLERTAAGDHHGAHRMGRMVHARFGERGVALLMAAWAQEIVEHAPAPVRNAFDRVQPQLVLPPAQLDEVVAAAGEGWSGSSPHAPATAEQHYARLGDYLTAVQRQDTGAANQLVRQANADHPTDAPVLFELLRVTAAGYTRQTPDLETS
ncbi:hypothetical protein AB0O20_02150 [Streptomyces kronopolitis]|uniref:hypothetical protein n=1 Tax=Streptomyces kronopolitis TaxID=1612435 RepID=UPI00342602CC